MSKIRRGGYSIQRTYVERRVDVSDHLSFRQRLIDVCRTVVHFSMKQEYYLRGILHNE